MCDDKRRIKRKRTYKRVKYTYNNSTNSVDCILRNKSDAGALLEFKNGSWVPDQFRLHDELEGYSVECKVVRRDGNTAGVMFMGEIEKVKPSRRQTITVSVEKPVLQKENDNSVAYSVYPARFGKRSKTPA